MYPSTHKICTDCGGEFKRSRADVTVRCPTCRGTRKPAGPPPPTPRELEVMKARAEARKARREHGTGSPEYAAAEARYFEVAR